LAKYYPGIEAADIVKKIKKNQNLGVFTSSNDTFASPSCFYAHPYWNIIGLPVIGLYPPGGCSALF
jgi:hypothetical protein